MSERSELLHQAADQQIADLLELTDQLTPDTLQRPCPGRQKLGDGTLGALVAHTTDNYKRIAAFASGQTGNPDGDTPPRDVHSMPRFLRVLGHRPPEHGTAYSADSAQPNEIAGQLHAVRASLRNVAALSDAQLDAIPADGSFRFCDGKRTFEQVLSALLKHQARQLDAIRSTSG